MCPSPLKMVKTKKTKTVLKIVRLMEQLGNMPIAPTWTFPNSNHPINQAHISHRHTDHTGTQLTQAHRSHRPTYNSGTHFPKSTQIIQAHIPLTQMSFRHTDHLSTHIHQAHRSLGHTGHFDKQIPRTQESLSHKSLRPTDYFIDHTDYSGKQITQANRSLGHTACSSINTNKANKYCLNITQAKRLFRNTVHSGTPITQEHRSPTGTDITRGAY